MYRILIYLSLYSKVYVEITKIQLEIYFLVCITVIYQVLYYSHYKQNWTITEWRNLILI